MLSVEPASRDGDDGSIGETESNVSNQSARNKWLLVLGACALAVVGWTILGGAPPEPEHQEAAVSTTEPVEIEQSESTAEVAPTSEVELSERTAEPEADAATSASSDFIARSSDGETPLEGVGEDLGFSLIARSGEVLVVINPNDGSAADLPIDPRDLVYLTETHAIRMDHSVVRPITTAQELWVLDSEPVILLEGSPNVDFQPGPQPDQVWLVRGDHGTLDLTDLGTGQLITSMSFADAGQHLLLGSELFSSRTGGIYERNGDVVTKLTDGFGVATSDALFLLAECDDQARCTTVWVDRATLEPLDYPAVDTAFNEALIDPTSRWLYTQNYFDEEFVIWEIATGRRMLDGEHFWSGMTFSPDGVWVALTDGKYHPEFIHIESGITFTVQVEQAGLGRGSTVFFPLEFVDRDTN